MPRVLRTTDRSHPLAFIPPLKPTLTARPPEGDQSLHDVKHDGYRTQLLVENRAARAFTMNGHDWTGRYPGLVHAAAKLKCRSVILDGEAMVQRENGVSDFHALRRALSTEPHRVVFFAFDLLNLDGQDLRKLALIDRRARLETLLGTRDSKSPLQQPVFQWSFSGLAENQVHG
jgi:bifunctional non-homologous end joining protein LigD